MKKSAAVPAILVLITFFTCTYPGFAQSKTETFTKNIADAYGLTSFREIKSIAFSFNVKTKNMNISRSWYWEPGSNKVTYKGPGKDGKSITYSYITGSIDKSDQMKTFVDSKFINDQYWLLFPFHLIWDKKAELTDKGMKTSPIGGKQMRCLSVKYPPSAGGYTPGDIFDLYIGKDNLIHEWVYREGGKKDGRALTWEGYKNFGGLNISTLHYAGGKNFKLWFSGIKVLKK